MASRSTIPENSGIRFKDVAKKNKVTVSALSRRARSRGIVGELSGYDGSLYFTKKQMREILRVTKKDLKNHPIKISIIDMLKEGKTPLIISNTLGVSPYTVRNCVNEYKQNGDIVVASKINTI